MEQLPDTTKQEITKLIEIALRPISGKVKSFSEPLQMAVFTQQGNSPETKRQEVLYPILINSNLDQLTLTVSSLHISNLWNMVEAAVHHNLLPTLRSSEEVKDQILKVLYSPEFLVLRQK